MHLAKFSRNYAKVFLEPSVKANLEKIKSDLILSDDQYKQALEHSLVEMINGLSEEKVDYELLADLRI